MFGSRKSLVYCSKDRDDWEKAKGLLAEAGIDITARNVEEPPVGGCGAKIDARSFLSGKSVSKDIYRIEVAPADRERAEAALKDKVLPVRHYGLG